MAPVIISSLAGGIFGTLNSYPEARNVLLHDIVSTEVIHNSHPVAFGTAGPKTGVHHVTNIFASPSPSVHTATAAVKNDAAFSNVAGGHHSAVNSLLGLKGGLPTQTQQPIAVIPHVVTNIGTGNSAARVTATHASIFGLGNPVKSGSVGGGPALAITNLFGGVASKTHSSQATAVHTAPHNVAHSINTANPSAAKPIQGATGGLGGLTGLTGSILGGGSSVLGVGGIGSTLGGSGVGSGKVSNSGSSLNNSGGNKNTPVISQVASSATHHASHPTQSHASQVVPGVLSSTTQGSRGNSGTGGLVSGHSAAQKGDATGKNNLVGGTGNTGLGGLTGGSISGALGSLLGAGGLGSHGNSGTRVTGSQGTGSHVAVTHAAPHSTIGSDPLAGIINSLLQVGKTQSTSAHGSVKTPPSLGHGTSGNVVGLSGAISAVAGSLANGLPSSAVGSLASNLAGGVNPGLASAIVAGIGGGALPPGVVSNIAGSVAVGLPTAVASAVAHGLGNGLPHHAASAVASGLLSAVPKPTGLSAGAANSIASSIINAHPGAAKLPHVAGSLAGHISSAAIEKIASSLAVLPSAGIPPVGLPSPAASNIASSIFNALPVVTGVAAGAVVPLASNIISNIASSLAATRTKTPATSAPVVSTPGQSPTVIANVATVVNPACPGCPTLFYTATIIPNCSGCSPGGGTPAAGGIPSLPSTATSSPSATGPTTGTTISPLPGADPDGATIGFIEDIRPDPEPETNTSTIVSTATVIGTTVRPSPTHPATNKPIKIDIVRPNPRPQNTPSPAPVIGSNTSPTAVAPGTGSQNQPIPSPQPARPNTGSPGTAGSNSGPIVADPAAPIAPVTPCAPFNRESHYFRLRTHVIYGPRVFDGLYIQQPIYGAAPTAPSLSSNQTTAAIAYYDVPTTSVAFWCGSCAFTGLVMDLDNNLDGVSPVFVSSSVGTARMSTAWNQLEWQNDRFGSWLVCNVGGIPQLSWWDVITNQGVDHAKCAKVQLLTENYAGTQPNVCSSGCA